MTCVYFDLLNKIFSGITVSLLQQKTPKSAFNGITT